MLHAWDLQRVTRRNSKAKVTGGDFEGNFQGNLEIEREKKCREGSRYGGRRI